MRCPKDIKPRDFQRLLEEAGPDMELEATTRVGVSRYFRFRATKKREGLRQGDHVEYPVATKFRARR